MGRKVIFTHMNLVDVMYVIFYVNVMVYLSLYMNTIYLPKFTCFFNGKLVSKYTMIPWIRHGGNPGF